MFKIIFTVIFISIYLNQVNSAKLQGSLAEPNGKNQHQKGQLTRSLGQSVDSVKNNGEDGVGNVADQLTARKLGKSIDNAKDGIEDKLGGGIEQFIGARGLFESMDKAENGLEGKAGGAIESAFGN